MNGLAPLNPLVLEAWARVHDIAIAPWEAEAIERVDMLLLAPPVSE